MQPVLFVADGIRLATSNDSSSDVQGSPSANGVKRTAHRKDNIDGQLPPAVPLVVRHKHKRAKYSIVKDQG